MFHYHLFTSKIHPESENPFVHLPVFAYATILDKLFSGSIPLFRTVLLKWFMEYELPTCPNQRTSIIKHAYEDRSLLHLFLLLVDLNFNFVWLLYKFYK